MKIKMNAKNGNNRAAIPSSMLALILIVSLFFVFHMNPGVKTILNYYSDSISRVDIVAAAVPRATTAKSMTTESNHEKCESVLNKFDTMFDERRRIRQMKDPLQGSLFNDIKNYMDLYEPEAVCFTDERFGLTKNGDERFGLTKNIEVNLKERYAREQRYDAFGDGPKFLCGVDLISSSASKSKDEKCLVYSVGSRNNVDFEMAVHKFIGCETHTFDPTVEKFVGDEYATFHQWGLGLDGANYQMKSFETIINDLGHQNRTIDILKIDCEGCEFTTMSPLLDLIIAGKVKVNQIQVEVHPDDIIKNADVVVEMIATLFNKMDEAKFRIFHKERNHWGYNGYKCLEYAFVNEDFLRKANKAAVC